MQIQSTCSCCQAPLDFYEHHPTILDKCGHFICNECKLNAITSEDEASGYINIRCPICKLAQENLKERDTKITNIFEHLYIQKVLKL
jgi:hypothetical protein